MGNGRSCVDDKLPAGETILHDFPIDVYNDWKRKQTRACAKTMNWTTVWQNPNDFDEKLVVEAIGGANVTMIATVTASKKVQKTPDNRILYTRKMIHEIDGIFAKENGVHYHFDCLTRECSVVYESNQKLKEVNKPIIEPNLLCVIRNLKKSNPREVDWHVRTIPQCKKLEDEEKLSKPINPQAMAKIEEDVQKSLGSSAHADGFNDAGVQMQSNELQRK